MGQSVPIKPRILVVEDEMLILEMLTEMLADGGFEVHAVSNANDALLYLVGDVPVDVLFTDINLAGGMDGSALALLAREMRPDLSVVYASGGVGSFKRDKAVPGSTFVPKPYNSDHICHVLEHAAAR